jgi:hypothetical protein
MDADVGTRFAQAVAARDAQGLKDLLAPDVDFRGLTPGRFWETGSATELVDDIVLGMWFEPTDHIDAVESVVEGSMSDRRKVEYRFRGRNGDGPFTVEQQAYFDVADGRITWLRIMCSGFRPLAASDG